MSNKKKLQSTMMNQKVKNQLENYSKFAGSSDVLVMSFDEYCLREINSLLKRVSQPQLLLA